MAERRATDTSMSQAPLPGPPAPPSSSCPPATINALLAVYHEKVKHIPTEEWGRASRAIRLLLEKGLTPSQIEVAIQQYAESFPTLDTKIKFAKAANRFFTKQTVEVWLAPPLRGHARPRPQPTYNYDAWCQHDPPCRNREWHAVKLRMEGS